MGVIAFSAYIVMFMVVQQTIVRHYRGVQPPGRTDPLWHYPLLAIAIPLILLSTATIPEKFDFTFPVIRIAGAAIAVAGLYLSMRAHWELGRNWVGGVGLHRQHRLITTGPYRRIRHPLYSGMLLSALGLGIFELNLFYTLGCLLFASSYAIRIVAEEQMLRKKFKKKYEIYAATSGMLIPPIRRRC